jgi:hypothetical protein
MTHEIKDNVYYIYDDEGRAILSIALTEESNNQIVLSTDNEVYAGPIDFIRFDPWIEK